MNTHNLSLGNPMSMREIYQNCFLEGSGMIDGWERLCNEWPMAMRVNSALANYLGAEIRSPEGPLVCTIIEKAVLRYTDTRVKHDYERLYEFVMGIVHGVRKMPNFKLNDKNDIWILGEHSKLPRWLRKRNASAIGIMTFPALTEEKAQMILGYILEENVLNWIKTHEGKLVRLTA